MVEYGLIWDFSIFYEGIPVTQYSPVVFDAFVNQIKVSPTLTVGFLLFETGIMNILSALGRVPVFSRPKRHSGRRDSTV